MNLYRAIQYLLFLAIVTALVKPLGGYMENVFSGKPIGLCRAKTLANCEIDKIAEFRC